jgi:hypothetical protein
LQGDWHHLIYGRIDAVSFAGDPIVVRGRDLGGWLANTQIEEEIAYATDAPKPIEEVMQQILDDWPIGGGQPAVVLDVPDSPLWAMNNAGNPPKVQQRRSVLEALQQDYALSIGWVCRYEFDEDDNYLLRFFDIDRTRTDPDDTFGPGEYRDITELEVSDDYVRNRIRGSCFDPDGKLIDLSVENLTSEAKYGNKFMGMDLAVDDPIDSEDELQTMLDAAKHDLGEPFATQSMETLLYWPVQLGDLYEFAANSVHYDDVQLLAVAAYSHRGSNGEVWTTMQCRGTIVGSFHAWFRKGVGDDVTPAEETESLNNFRWTDSADGTQRTYRMSAGANVFRVAVFDKLVEVPALTDPWPQIGTPPTVILVPDPVTREITYVATKPSLLTERYIQFEPRFSDWRAGPVRRNVLPASPTALDAAIHAAVTNATADLSAVITGSVADWPVQVDFFEDDPNGAAIATTSISANATLTKLTVGLAALGARTLPQRELRKWWIKLTNVAGEVKWAGPASADRDALPAATFTLNDYRAAPSITVNYDDDTDSVKFFLPGGKTKTYAGLSGSGSVTYTVGDAVDVGSVENAMAIDETRTGYSVQVLGGGQWLTIMEGKLHGATTGPSLTVTPTPGNPNYSIAWTGSGTITLSIDGGAYSTPPASPIVVARHATADKTYSFKCVQAGQTIIDTVTIPSLASVAGDTDTITPDLTVTPGTRTDTSQAFTVTAVNPAGGAAPTITVTPYNTTMVIGGVTYSTAQTVASGTVVTVNRPATTATEEAHIRFRASIGTGGAEDITISVPKQTNIGPTLDLNVTPGNPNYSIAYTANGTVTYATDGGAFSTPGASPVAVARAASANKVVTFKCVKDGQTITNSVTVPSLAADIDTPNLTVVPGTPTATTQPYTPTSSNPSGGTAPVITVTPYNCSMVIAGVTYTTAQVVASGTVVTVNRPISTETGQAHIAFVAAIAGGGSQSIDIDIIAQLNVGPTLIVTPTPGSANYSFAYSGNGAITYSINGGGYVTPPSSPVSIARDAVDPKNVTFKAVLDGQTVVDSITIPPLSASTTTPDLSVTVGTPAATTQPYTVSATNPNGGSTPTITVTPVNCDMVISGVTYSTAQTVASGTVVTVNRPSSTNANQAHVKFRASIAGGGAEEIIRTVPYQINLGPTLIVNSTPGPTDYTIDWSGTGTVTYSIDGASFVTPPASPITVARDTTDHSYVFKASKDGQDIVAQVSIPRIPLGSSGITSISTSAQFSPCDGGGQVDVDWSWIGLPAGTTFDIYVSVTSGIYNGNSNTSFNNSAGPVTIGAAFCPGESFNVFIIAHAPGGEVVGTASSDFTS